MYEISEIRELFGAGKKGMLKQEGLGDLVNISLERINERGAPRPARAGRDLRSKSRCMR